METDANTHGSGSFVALFVFVSRSFRDRFVFVTWPLS